MKLKVLVLFAAAFLTLVACNQTTTRSANQISEDVNQTASGKAGNTFENSKKNFPAEIEGDQNSKTSVDSQIKEPKTVMEFFALLPEKYFTLEGCFREEDKDCRIARAEYLKNFKEIEDIKNGYLKAGCDGAQSCIEMALFKRPDNTYLVAVSTFAEMIEENYFLDYKNGAWTDISANIVPEYSKDKRYEIPRVGTSVKVFSTKLIEKIDNYEIRERDKRIYDLEWKNGKFSIKK